MNTHTFDEIDAFLMSLPEPPNAPASEGGTAGDDVARKAVERMQSAVWRWCEVTFEGIAAWQTDKERAYRFFEEAGELFQAMGMGREDAIKVVDYVYGRPVGEVSQEIGGVMITLLALASQQRQSVSKSLETEYERIIRPEIQAKIRDKQIKKNQAFL